MYNSKEQPEKQCFEQKTLLSAEVPITTLDGKDPRGYFLRSSTHTEG